MIGSHTPTLDATKGLVTVPSTAHDLVELMTHAEVLQIIISLKDDQTFLMRPKNLQYNSLRDLSRKETKVTLRNRIRGLLD